MQERKGVEEERRRKEGEKETAKEGRSSGKPLACFRLLCANGRRTEEKQRGVVSTKVLGGPSERNH